MILGFYTQIQLSTFLLLWNENLGNSLSGKLKQAKELDKGKGIMG
jgi:hypothetical protein